MLKHRFHVGAIRERVDLLQKNPLQFPCGEAVCFYTCIGNDLYLSRKEVRPDQYHQEGGGQKRSRMFHRVLPRLSARRLEINTGLYYQSVRVGFEALRVHFWIKPVWERAESVTIHEVTLHLHVPKSFQVNSRRQDFVINVIA